MGQRWPEGRGGGTGGHSILEQLQLCTPGEDGSNTNETSGFPPIVTSLNFYVKIFQLVTIDLNLFKNTVCKYNKTHLLDQFQQGTTSLQSQLSIFFLLLIRRAKNKKREKNQDDSIAKHRREYFY